MDLLQYGLRFHSPRTHGVDAERADRQTRHPHGLCFPNK
jgi:hypothetical protein